MNKTSRLIKIIIQIIILTVLVGGLAFYFYNDYQKSKITKDSKSEIINQIITLKIVRDDLDQRKINRYRKAFEVQTKKFLADPQSAEAFWALIKIEQIKQLVGDYQGAEQALLWAVKLQPKSYLAHGNLANLYFHHFKDFAKAEEHYLKAIESNNPKTLSYYLDLHQLYRYFYKQDTNLAEEILKQGITKYPQTTDLMLVLADYYRSLDRNQEAIEYYQKVLKINPQSQVAKKGLEDLKNRIE